MTNPTPHGQVPEVLIDLIDAYAETRHRCGGIYNARTEAARKAVIEALSGVQALSAAPAVPAGWKAVPVNPTPEMWKAAKTVPDPNPPYPPHYGLVWDAMLAASPTPPAEQAAPKAAPTLPEGWTDCTIEFGNDGPEVVAYGPKRMMNRLAKWLGKYFAQVIADAATKAAPGEPSDADIDAFLDSPGGIEWVIADKRERYRLLVRAVLAKWAAPQQEAQEPAFVDVSLRTAIAKAVYQQVRVEFDYKLGSWTALDADEQQRIVDSIRGLYTAPQPAQGFRRGQAAAKQEG